MTDIIIISDMHIGSTVALCPPTVTLDDGGVVPPEPVEPLEVGGVITPATAAQVAGFLRREAVEMIKLAETLESMI